MSLTLVAINPLIGFLPLRFLAEFHFTYFFLTFSHHLTPHSSLSQTRRENLRKHRAASWRRLHQQPRRLLRKRQRGRRLSQHERVLKKPLHPKLRPAVLWFPSKHANSDPVSGVMSQYVSTELLSSLRNNQCKVYI